MTEQSPNKLWITILGWTIPIIIAILSGYGSVVFTNGVREQRLINVETKVTELQRQNERAMDRYITREELKAYLDGQTSTLQQIQMDLRMLRNR